MGDAIAHAVLPGLVLAFVFSGSMNIVPLFIGAAAVGLLTTFLTQTLHQYGRVPTDASMGVVFTSLFALGVVLLKRYVARPAFRRRTACSKDCCPTAGCDTFDFAGLELPRQLRTVVPGRADQPRRHSRFVERAEAQLVRPRAGDVDGLLRHADALPADGDGGRDDRRVVRSRRLDPRRRHADRPAGHRAAAVRSARPDDRSSLASSRSSRRSSATGFAMPNASSGAGVAPAGAMVVAAGGMYALAVLFSPQYGILSTLVRNLQTALRILREDLLLMLYRLEEIDPTKRMRPARSRRGRRRRLARPLGAGDAAPPRPRRSPRRPAAHDRRRPLARGPPGPRTSPVGNVPRETPRPAARPRPRPGRPRRTLHQSTAARRAAKRTRRHAPRPARPRNSRVQM